jgi:hypothetical protein
LAGQSINSGFDRLQFLGAVQAKPGNWELPDRPAPPAIFAIMDLDRVRKTVSQSADHPLCGSLGNVELVNNVIEGDAEVP